MVIKIKLIIILVLIAALIGGFYLASLILSPASRESKVTYFSIESGETVEQIAQDLKEQKLIKSELAFKAYVRFVGAGKKFAAGQHQLGTNMSTREIVGALTSSDNISNEKKIIILEGWRAEDIASYLARANLVDKKEFLKALRLALWRDKYDFLKEVPANNLEGFLFPDTYRVFADATSSEIIKKMLDNFNQKLTEKMRADIKRQNGDVFSVIILASIIEREGLSDNDKKMIADVFIKRLEKGIGLQSDATINYITGKGDLRPSLADLQIDSPYNTYKYRGLPPGPISNPGLVSIMATIYPQQNDYYYFLTDKNGKAIFAKTYEEHQANIRKYLE
ncbi:MAG: endolytic transglycosylase MltG [Patescibacteria group bacterium]